MTILKARRPGDRTGVVEAQALRLDEALIEAPARTEDEPRFLVVGCIGGRHWSAVCVKRGDRTRIISVRRSRKEEIKAYEGA
ncbi:MAG TPA: BrnT family toxin [Roseiarcus sp.]|nr:BrnT family toxin [Roseiarcus sp.]